MERSRVPGLIVGTDGMVLVDRLGLQVPENSEGTALPAAFRAELDKALDLNIHPDRWYSVELDQSRMVLVYSIWEQAK